VEQEQQTLYLVHPLITLVVAVVVRYGLVQTPEPLAALAVLAEVGRAQLLTAQVTPALQPQELQIQVAVEVAHLHTALAQRAGRLAAQA
jgi:uncharacterized membrane protein